MTLITQKCREALKNSQKVEVRKIMAETETNVSTVDTQSTQQQSNEPAKAQENNTPTVEELMAQLATERAEKEKYKSASDKASSEAAKYKKELRSKQTAEEQELESLRKELNHNKAVSAYKAITDEKVVETLIEAVSESDHNAIAAIIESQKKAAVKEAQAEWLKSRPQANAGAYSSMTKEQIMAIPDRNERIRAIAQNQHLFS